jgi:hypothetical protein
MPSYELRVGGHIDVLDKRELDDALTKQTKALLAAAEGVKHFYFSATGLISGGATVQIPGPQSGSVGQLQQPTLGPEDGYVWTIQRVTIDGLTTATDKITFYRNYVSPQTHLYSVTGQTEFYHPGSCASVLRGGDQLIAAGSGLVSTGTLTLSGEAFEAPAEMIAKLAF